MKNIIVKPGTRLPAEKISTVISHLAWHRWRNY
jgi:hypothetical protein